MTESKNNFNFKSSFILNIYSYKHINIVISINIHDSLFAHKNYKNKHFSLRLRRAFRFKTSHFACLSSNHQLHCTQNVSLNFTMDTWFYQAWTVQRLPFYNIICTSRINFALHSYKVNKVINRARNSEEKSCGQTR